MYLDQAKADFERSRRMVYEVMSRDDEEHALNLGGKKPEVAVRGCTDEEVAALEQRIGHTLPAAYREFLRWMGHSGGYFLERRDTFYSDLEDLQEYAPRLLKANHITTPLPNDTFVFFVLRGFFFFFFRLSEGDNPPVYFYCDSDDKDNVFRLYFARYSDYLESQLTAHIAIAEYVGKWQRERQERSRRKSEPPMP